MSFTNSTSTLWLFLSSLPRRGQSAVPPLRAANGPSPQSSASSACEIQAEGWRGECTAGIVVLIPIWQWMRVLMSVEVGVGIDMGCTRLIRTCEFAVSQAPGLQHRRPCPACR